MLNLLTVIAGEHRNDDYWPYVGHLVEFGVFEKMNGRQSLNRLLIHAAAPLLERKWSLAAKAANAFIQHARQMKEVFLRTQPA